VAETAAVAEAEAVAQAVPLKDFGVRDALKSSSFWIYIISGFCASMGGYAGFVNFQSIRLSEVGFSIEVAALYFGLSFIFTQIGRMLCVVGSDLIHPSIAMGLCRILYAAGIFCFAFASSPWWLWGYVICYGIGYGYSIPASGVLIGGLFGRERWGTIYGLATGVGVISAIPGPLIFAFLREQTGSYFIPYLFMAGMLALGGVVVMFARTPKGQIAPGRRGASIGAH